MHEETFSIAAMVLMGAIALAALLPAALRLAIVPAVVLEILFGVVIGPQGLGLLGPSVTLDMIAQLGLAVLFLIAGFEINPTQVRGSPTRLAIRGWMASLVVAGLLAFAGSALGLFPAAGFVAVAISTTAIGTLMPILKDRGMLAPPYGPYVLAAGAAGEAFPLVALSLFLAGTAGFGAQSIVLVVFALVAVLFIVFAGRVRTLRLPPVLRDTIASSGQFPIRLALFLAVSLALFGKSVGLDLVLGAFVAGAVLRALVPENLHHDLMTRLAAVGYGFLIPIFFVTSGMKLDIAALSTSPVAIGLVPVFVMMMLIARGLPVLWLYRKVLPVRQRVALAFHSGTQLPLVVAITTIAVAQGAMPDWCSASLVMAAVITVMLFPAIASVVARDPVLKTPRQ
jgi:Kef-type K+ transport system membrane component KefB